MNIKPETVKWIKVGIGAVIGGLLGLVPGEVWTSIAENSKVSIGNGQATASAAPATKEPMDYYEYQNACRQREHEEKMYRLKMMYGDKGGAKESCSTENAD